MSFKDSILRTRTAGASDLHLEAGTPIVARVRGQLTPLGEVLTGVQLTEMAKELLTAEDWADFNVRGSADISLVVAGTRCRINFYRTIRGLAMAARLLSSAVGDLRACNLHPDLRRLVSAPTGLVIVSGPTGCGKSTTLAALLEEVNVSRAQNIITLESPLEYVYTNRRSFIRQREIPTHSPSFEQAIVDALRENPDVLVISEMRTAEVMRLTLDAAETGHLVLATLHSASCGEALSRICMSFPADIQGSIRAQLADCLVGVVCQRLEYLEKWQIRVPRCEVLLPNSGARGTIRAGQFGQIANVIQSGGEEGMWTFDRYQRWMEQQREWVRPTAPAAAAVSDEIVRSTARVAAPPVAPARRTAPAAARQPAASVPRADAPAAGPDEITIDEDLDLEDIAELARKIERRTP
ncbi:MAG TPA: ATPase, T2SS/T4P/T4SS family [Steroidobacteraceae bacterium]|nr:ATPase, T2SS/T4P/T4SS family [Steroidobacteraceae bacterium]